MKKKFLVAVIATLLILVVTSCSPSNQKNETLSISLIEENPISFVENALEKENLLMKMKISGKGSVYIYQYKGYTVFSVVKIVKYRHNYSFDDYDRFIWGTSSNQTLDNLPLEGTLLTFTKSRRPNDKTSDIQILGKRQVYKYHSEGNLMEIFFAPNVLLNVGQEDLSLRERELLSTLPSRMDSAIIEGHEFLKKFIRLVETLPKDPAKIERISTEEGYRYQYGKEYDALFDKNPEPFFYGQYSEKSFFPSFTQWMEKNYSRIN
jgi:hypothetical protein